jgi:hypothetical protein
VFARFYLATSTWKVVQSSLIPPLVGHRTALRKGGNGYVVGGMDLILGKEKPNYIVFFFTNFGAQCKCACASGMAPTQRMWPVCEIVDPYVLVVGGSVHGSPFAFDLRTSTWFKPNHPPFFVSLAASCSDGGDVFIHGGRNEQEAIDTRYLYRVRIKGEAEANDPVLDLLPDPEEDIWARDMLQRHSGA